MSAIKQGVLYVFILLSLPLVYGKCTGRDDSYEQMLQEQDDGPVATKTIDDYKIFAIGEAFNLGNTDFYSTLTQGKAIIDRDSAKECFRFSDATDSSSSVETSTDLSNVYRSVSKEADLSADFTYYVSLKSSLQAISSSMKWERSKAKTSNVDYSSQVSILSLEAGCIRKYFTESFKADLETLDVKIERPELESSWRNYEAFVKRYGSHMMSRISFGARFQYFTATQSTESLSDNMMGARACADVEGTTPGDSPFKVQGCSAYTKEQREESQSYHMQLKKFIRGGDKKLRNQLLLAQTLDPDVIEAFINTANESPQGIRYAFEAIWDLLPNEMSQQKANFYAYYTGYVQTGCTQLLGSSPNFVIRQFRHDPQDASSFQCVTSSRGCHHNNDCSYSYGLAGCQCGGSTCVEYDGYGVPFIKTEPSGGIWDAVSEKCKYYFLQGCYCENNNPPFVLNWPTAPRYIN